MDPAVFPRQPLLNSLIFCLMWGPSRVRRFCFTFFCSDAKCNRISFASVSLVTVKTSRLIFSLLFTSFCLRICFPLQSEKRQQLFFFSFSFLLHSAPYFSFPYGSSVVDPDHFDSGPNPNSHFDASTDLDPTL